MTITIFLGDQKAGPPRGLPVRWLERWLTISGRLRDRWVLSDEGSPRTLAGRTVAAVGARLGSPSSAPIFGASPQKLVCGALNRFFLDPQIHWRRLSHCPSIFLGLYFVRGRIRPAGQDEADTLPEAFD